MTRARRIRRRRPVTATPRVGLVGFFGEGNLGNDGSLEAMLTYLRDEHPDAVIDVLCGHTPDRVAERFGVPTARWRWYRAEPHSGLGLSARAAKALGTAVGLGVDAYRICAWVRRHDVVIVPGMGVLEATLPLRPWQTPYLMFLTCGSGRLFDTRVALVSVGANVIRQRLSKRLFVAAARCAHYRSFRDAGSRDAMRQMGLEVSGDRVYPDLAFSLPVPRGGSPAPGSVGVAIMDYSGGSDDRLHSEAIRARYTDAMTRLVLWLADNDRPVLLLAGDTRDERVIAPVLADLRAQRPALDRSALTAVPASSLGELMQQLEGVETVVATRFHTVLCALRLGKPLLAVGYSAKFDSLMAEMGLAKFSLPAKSIDVDVLIDRFNDLEGKPAHCAERNAANGRLLNAQFAELSTVLFDRAPITGSRRPTPRTLLSETTMDEVLSSNGNGTAEEPVSAARLYAKDFWSDENLKYVEPHFRMLKLARTITRLAEGRTPSLLDIGCGPATLRRLIPPTVQYHGIDIAIHEQGPNLMEADIVKSPIKFRDQKFDIVIAQGFFEYVGEYESQKFDEIVQLLAPGGTFIVSYVNFAHRKPDVYQRYSNVRPIEEFRSDLARHFTIRQFFPTSHNWSHTEPNRSLIRAGNMRLNLNVPFLTPRLAVQYLFICAARD